MDLDEHISKILDCVIGDEGGGGGDEGEM